MLRPLLLSLILIALLAACAPAAPQAASPSASPTAAPTTAQAKAKESPAVSGVKVEKVTLYMGFVPNVQFAPFYVALDKGYFKDEGIDLTLDYGMETDLIKLLAAGQAQFVVGSGDQVILARSQGLPIVYVMNWYRKFPVAVFSLSPLTSPQDLKGKKVGIPGQFGATYIGLRGLLYAAKVDEKSVTMPTIGFTQVESLLKQQVDAAVGYSMNEPLQLKQSGQTPGVIEVSQYIDLVANGLMSNEKTVQDNPDLIRRMVRASLRGLRDTLAQPDAAFETTLKAIPEAAKTREAQRATLEASLGFWRTDRLGQSDPQAWQTSARFMKDVGLIATEVDPSRAFTNEFIPDKLP